MYSELRQSHAKAEKRLMDNEARCLTFVPWMHQTIASMLAWRANRDPRPDRPAPATNRHSPGGYVNAKGLRVALTAVAS